MLIASAAVIAAGTAAFTANYRMKRQLQHDRQMRELEELRSTLDDAAVAANRALQAIKFAKLFAKTDDGRLRAIVDEKAELFSAISHEGGRLALRFGIGHTVPAAYWAYYQAALATFDDIGPNTPWSPDAQAAVDSGEKNAHELMADFARKCRPYVRVEL